MVAGQLGLVGISPEHRRTPPIFVGKATRSSFEDRNGDADLPCIELCTPVHRLKPRKVSMWNVALGRQIPLKDVMCVHRRCQAVDRCRPPLFGSQSRHMRLEFLARVLVLDLARLPSRQTKTAVFNLKRPGLSAARTAFPMSVHLRSCEYLQLSNIWLPDLSAPTCSARL